MLHDPVIDLSPGAARRLSLVALAGLALGYPADAIIVDLPLFADRLIGGIKLIGLLATVVLFLDTPFRLVNAKDRALDDRLRHERDRALATSHRIVVPLLFAGFVYAYVAEALGWWLPAPRAAIDLLSAFAIFSMALPAIVLAWRRRPAFAA